MHNTIAIVFVNYFSKEDIHTKINEIKDLNKNVKVIVVDNSGEYSQLMNEDIIFTEENLGYAGGNNLILENSNFKSNDWILICNPDLTDIKWDYVFNILHTSSSKIISFRGNNKSFNQIYWKEIKRYFSVNVPSVYGCFFAIKYDFFKLLNGFNKDYFMYGEEHDLAFRLLSKGYNIHEDLSKCYYRKNTENFKMYNWKLKLRIINNLCTIHSTITGTSKYKILILRFAYDFYFLVKNFKLNLFPFLLNANLLSINQLNINRLRRHVIQSRG